MAMCRSSIRCVSKDVLNGNLQMISQMKNVVESYVGCEKVASKKSC